MTFLSQDITKILDLNLSHCYCLLFQDTQLFWLDGLILEMIPLLDCYIKSVFNVFLPNCHYEILNILHLWDHIYA